MRIHEIDGALALRDSGIFPAAREIKSQSGHRLPCRFQLGAFGMCIEVQIDRRPVDNLGNLVILVIVVEEITVQRQRAIQKRVLRTSSNASTNSGLNVNGCIGCTLKNIAVANICLRGEDRTGRIGAAAL